MRIHPLRRGFITLTAMNRNQKSCFVAGMWEGLTVKKLQELQTKSSFITAFINLHEKDFPYVFALGSTTHLSQQETRQLVDALGRHSYRQQKEITIVLLCMRDKALKSTEKLCFHWESTTVGNIHQSEGGRCTFHPLVKCSSKGCKTDIEGFVENLKCTGEPYHSANVLKCECHALAYEIECFERAKHGEEVIDPGPRKCHSNLPESTFSVLTKI